MILHSPLTIIEHHHNQINMFPDYGRQVPFGTGTSIMYNYLDFQFANNTDKTFQLVTYTTDSNTVFHKGHQIWFYRDVDYTFLLAQVKSLQ